MTTDDLVVVTGAPGNVGTAVVRHLLRRGARVRVVGRHLERIRATFGDAVEAGRLNFGDRRSYVEAFRGARRLFIVRPPQVSNVTRDMVPALDVALGAGVTRMALLSLQGADRNPLAPHRKLEQYLQGAGVEFTLLRPGFFMQNLITTHLPELQARREVYVPAGQGRTAFVDAADVGEVGALVLSEDGHAGRAYELTGSQALTYGEVAAIFSQVSGLNIRYADPTPLAFYRQMRARGLAAGYILVMEALYAAARLGQAAHLSPELGRLLGRDPTTLLQVAQAHRGLIAGQPSGPQESKHAED
ncbi:SDR family oxidoreductase [Deinococcus sp.]|uniref:SDR family oxidoreductase n=1 Tax=Deinococcus sp. TaxID=47478 RepID=UPI003CC5E404